MSFFLNIDHDSVQLKTTSDWYTQIQLTAWATHAEYAYLCLYSGKECKALEVELNWVWA